MERFFASDNAAGAHPAVLAAITRANGGHALAYGADDFTAQAIATLREEFGDEAQVAFTFGGTGANVVALSAVLQPYDAVVCADSAHLYRDEAGAPERFLGAKLIPAPAQGGKLSAEAIEPVLHREQGVHRVSPRVLSIAQASEWGTVYRPDELRALASFAHERGMLLHVDGARLANAAAALDLPLRALTTDIGVDVLSFGGTKNGMLYGEAVLWLTPEHAPQAARHHKQAMQLPSKMRFIAAQFSALLQDELWRELALHANRMARALAEGLQGLRDVEIVQPVETNAVFARIPPATAARAARRIPFHVWDAPSSIARFMASFDTTPQDVDALVREVRDAL